MTVMSMLGLTQCGLFSSEKTRMIQSVSAWFGAEEDDEVQYIPEDKDPFMLPLGATNDEKAKRYYNAGCILGEGKQAKFSDGSVWSERELYLKAVELKPNFADAFGNLATDLAEGETICLPGDTQEWNEQQLYLMAIQCDHKNALHWNNLALVLKSGEEVLFPGGGAWDRRMLLLKSLELSQSEAETYYQLAKTYKDDDTESLKFADGREWTEQDLYMMAIDLDSKHAEAYHALGKTLDEGEQIKLKNGKKYTKEQLLAKAQELDPDQFGNDSDEEADASKGGA